MPTQDGPLTSWKVAETASDATVVSNTRQALSGGGIPSSESVAAALSTQSGRITAAQAAADAAAQVALTAPVTADRLPAKTMMHVVPTGVTWPARPTSSLSIQVVWWVPEGMAPPPLGGAYVVEGLDRIIYEVPPEVTLTPEQMSALVVRSELQDESSPSYRALVDAAGSLSDDQVASSVSMPGTATRVALEHSFSALEHQPINVAQSYGRDNAGVRAALAAAQASKRPLYFPWGDYSVTGDLVVTTPIDIRGDGYGSRLLITDGALLFDGSGGFLMHPKIRDLRIRRNGSTAGPALHMKGAGNSTGVARVTSYHVHCSSPNGDGLLVEGSYLLYFFGCYFEESQVGIRGREVNLVGANAMIFVGGEANGNQVGFDVESPNGVAFYGFTVEGNYTRGGIVRGSARGFAFRDGYFEHNAGPDLEIDVRAGSGVIIAEGNFASCNTPKSESFLLRRGMVAINHNFFMNLNEGEGDVAIRVIEGSSPVRGEARNNMRYDDGTVIDYGTSTALNVTQVGRVTKPGSTVTSGALNEQAGIAWMRKVSQAVDLSSIPANGEGTFTVNVPGAVVTDDVSVSSSMLEAGLSIAAWGVTGPGTVTVRLRNNTNAAIDPSARTWRVRVWR